MKEWFKARNVWGATILALPDEEAGKIAKAIWAYTMDGELLPLEGSTKGIFPMILMTLQQDEERDAEISEKRSKATEGIRKQKTSNDIKRYQMISNDIKGNQMTSNDGNKNKNQNKNEESEQESESEFISADEAANIQNDHNKVLDAAQDAGFKGSNSERAGLLNLYAAYGLEKMLNGISECMKHSAPNLAYLEAVLKGTGRKAASGGYEQRDYTATQDEAMERMMKAEW